MKPMLSPRVFLHDVCDSVPALPENTIALAQIPSAAFGDGTHPTTRLCAGVVDLLCRQNRPNHFLDVGTGTGILARIARARGARWIAATDIDPAALRAAQANCALDRSSTEILLSDHSPNHWNAHFDLIVANILEEPLRGLAAALHQALAPGGTLLISGFTPLQIPSLRVAFEAAGLTFSTESALENWSLLIFRKEKAE